MKALLPFLLVLSVSCEKSSRDDVDSTPEELVQEDSAIVTEPASGNLPAEAAPPEKEAPPEAEVAAPLDIPSHQFEMDARASTESIFFKLENGKLIKVNADQEWAFAVKRTQFQTNSGTSGSLNIGVLNSETTDYESITECGTGTFVYDAMLPASGAPGSQPYSGNALLNAWYNYDAVTHAVTSKKLVYLMSDGKQCFKLQIQSYSSGLYTVLADALEIPAQVPAPTPTPLVYEQNIDASSTTATLYLKLEDGQLVSSSSDQAWLFAVKRTQFQTNSGTSGTRGVGVHNTGSTDFASGSSCNDLTYTYDELLPASGAPGSEPYSGNAILNAWYNYDFATHTVQSKQLVYFISDGTECLKLQILAYASGIYTMKVTQL